MTPGAGVGTDPADLPRHQGPRVLLLLLLYPVLLLLLLPILLRIWTWPDLPAGESRRRRLLVRLPKCPATRSPTLSMEVMVEWVWRVVHQTTNGSGVDRSHEIWRRLNMTHKGPL